MNSISLPITDYVLLFFALIFIILFAPILSRQIKLPGIVGIIIAGVIMGPNGLNIIPMSAAIELLGAVGLLYIMLLAGLEINLQDFKRNKEKSLIFGILTFIIPQITGTVLFRLLGFNWPAAVLIASMFASHTLVGYPIITRLGIVRNRAVLTTVGGTIIADTLALLVLAVVARSANGALDLNFWITLSSLSAVYVFSMVYLLPILGRIFFRYNDDGIIQFHFVLVIAFLCSYLARLIGIEPIVGAFLAGLVLNRMVPASSQLMNRVQFVGNSLFIPFFLLYIGMIVDIEILIKSPASWIIMAIMLATNMITKLVSSKLTQKIFRFSNAEGWLIFGLSTTEAAATLAATLVGYRLGIIGDEILNGVVLMILVTCIIGPWVVEHFGKKIASENISEKIETEKLPHLLVPVSNPASAINLLSVAFVLKEYTEGQILALAVITNPKKIYDGTDNSDKLLEDARNYAVSGGISLKTLKRIDVNIANGISRAALEEHADLIIMGWNGKITAPERIFGTVLDQLLEKTIQTVFVCKIEKSIMSSSRIVTFIPTNSVKEPGFYGVFKILTNLAKGLNCPLLFSVETGTYKIIQTILKGNKLESEVKFQIISDEDHFKTIASEIKRDDMIFAFGAQRNTMSWKPFSDKIPNKLATKFIDNNFIIAYPGLTSNMYEAEFDEDMNVNELTFQK